MILRHDKILFFLVMAGYLGVGCGETQAGGNDANAALEGIANVVILPNYQKLVSEIETLDAAAAAFCARPDAETLDGVRGAWRGVRDRWKMSEAFYLGPAHDLRARAAFDWPSVSADKIEGFLVDTTTTLNDNFFDNAPADARGLWSLEYLLFDADDGEPERVALSAFLGNGAAKRCEYVRGLVGAMGRSAQRVLVAWEPDGEDFLGDFSGRSRLTYKTSQEALSVVVNGVVFAVEDAANLYLGVALLLDGAAVFDPKKIPMHLSDHALADIEAALLGAQAVYMGDFDGVEGAGVDVLVRARKAEVDDVVNNRFTEALAAVRAVNGPLEEAAVAEVQAAFDAIKALQAVLEAEVSPVLGVSLTFNDNDGD